MLCGGQSRRMATSKIWLAFGRENLLQRMVRIAHGTVAPVIVAARPGQSLPSLPGDVTVVHDSPQHHGPLAGMAAAFDILAEQCDAAFVTACDYPFLQPAFIARLIELLADHPAVVPVDAEHVHALMAVYRLDTRTILADMLKQSGFRAQDFVERCSACLVPVADFADADPKLDSLRNVNDPETYERAIRELCD